MNPIMLRLGSSEKSGRAGQADSPPIQHCKQRANLGHLWKMRATKLGN